MNINKQEIKREEISVKYNKEYEELIVNTYKNNFENWNSWQIFYLIKDKNYVFSETKIKMDLPKNKFKLDKDFEIELNKFYNKYKRISLISDFKEEFKEFSIFNDEYLRR